MKLNEIKDFEKEILLLVKFTKPDYLQSILDGNLYMNNIKYFVDLENTTKIKGQGDKHEASNVISNVNFKMFTYGTNELVAEGYAETIIERNNVYDTIPVFCITAFEAADFRIIEETSDSYKVIFDIPEEEIQKMQENFGEKAVIFNPVHFLNRIDDYYSESGIEYMARKVDYVNLKINTQQRIESYKELTTTPLFTKDIFFQYQREFRVALLNNHVEKFFITELGKFNDKTFHVMDIKDFFNQTLLEVQKRNK